MSHCVTEAIRTAGDTVLDVTDKIVDVVEGSAFSTFPDIEGSGPDSIFFDSEDQSFNDQVAHFIWSGGNSVNHGLHLLADNTDSAIDKAKKYLQG